jgi:hypothetical protein
MRFKTILICIAFVAGFLLASCSASSNTCPAYSNAGHAERVEVNG